MMTLLESALRYIRLGWPVFPLQVRGKLPMIPKEQGGHGSLDATLNEALVREWWTRWPAVNVGLATGHGWFAVDVDTRKGGDETWDMLRAQHAALPSTPEQITGGGGRHILYQEPPDFKVKNSEARIGPGLDVRGQGGYIVGCPSIHRGSSLEPGEIDLVRRTLALRKVGRTGVLWADDGRYYISESEVGLYGSRRRVSLEALVVQAEWCRLSGKGTRKRLRIVK